jgi:hypothetical protein
MRCVGVLEVCKEFARTWSVDMRRRVAVVHPSCRLPGHVQGALGRLAETSHASTLFVLTCTRRAALDSRIVSRALIVNVPSCSSIIIGNSLSVSLPAKTVASALTAGRTTCAAAAVWTLARIARRQQQQQKKKKPAGETADDGSDASCEFLTEFAKIDHSCALVRSMGGDLSSARSLVGQAFVLLADKALDDKRPRIEE